MLRYLAIVLAAALALPVRAGATGCDADLGGVSLPPGFCATVFADKLGSARHLTVGPNGTVYVALEGRAHGGGIVALRDADGDGHADEVKYFGDSGGTGIALHAGYLYFATDTEVLRYRLKEGELAPSSAPESAVRGFPDQNQHAAKSIAIDPDGNLYVNVGAPSNACQQADRAAGSPGLRPCPLLARHGGLWRFDANRAGQVFGKDGARYASGIRNAVAIAWDPLQKMLYALQMGRDQLADDWPKLYSAAQSAEIPAEELFAVHAGDDFGWPYCYYDQLQHKKVLAPEYGGDGKATGECGGFAPPIAAYPGHWAPEAVLFYSGAVFPSRYRDGAFISFHGSWNRAPLPQAGYKLIFQPLKDGRPSGDYEVFADGFAGGSVRSPDDARFRPMGLAQGPDGELYIGDSQQGRIWRVIYSPKP
jgi:glucose/arabinose dehydrogenase